MASKIQSLCCFFFFFAFTIATGENEYNADNILINVHKYNLTIFTEKVHFEDKGENEKFKGDVEIKFEIKSTTTQIALDKSPEMEITEALLNDTIKGNSANNSKIIFKIDKPGVYVAHIKYNAPFGKDMSGLYRSSYKEGNKTRWILTSHFEPIFARKAFPCFDQPKLKASFKLKFLIPAELSTYYVLSNTPCKKGKSVDKSVEHECDEIVEKMSTYLLAFTISDLQFTRPEKFNSNLGKYGERELRTYGQKEMIDYGGKLPQDVGLEAIKKLTEYTKIGYAFKKVDQVGIPDFSAGAMENWGLILFREKILFFNEKTGSILTKQSNILTIIHELVHQWFGNLVTLESWDYIWLNEAFATYFQYYIADKFTLQNPDIKKWDYLKQHVVNDIHLRAFETDGLISSKCMSYPIKDESLVFSFFNDINYSKGSAILRMWDLSLEKDTFQKSLQEYVKERQFNSANPGHLLSAFKKHSKMDEKFFKNWTENPGYPVVSVVKKDKDFVLSQTRFLYEKAGTEDKNKYYIPITYYTNENIDSSTQPKYWLYDNDVKIPAKGNWIIVNTNQAGYYRVNYEENNWKALAKALREKEYSKILELNRAQIVNDIFSLARSNQKEYVKYTTALDLAQYLQKENSYVTWKTALHSFDFIRNKLFGDKKIYSNFEVYLLNLIQPHFKGLQLTELPHIERLKAIEIARWACLLNYKNCTQKADALYKEFLGNKPLNPDTQEIILCTVARLQKNSTEQIFKKYSSETDTAIKIMYLNALGCSGDKKFINELLRKTFDQNSGIRKQDHIYVMSSVTNGNLENIQTVFDFVKTYYVKIAEEYGGIDPLGRALVGLAKKLNSDADLKTFEGLINDVKKNPKTKASVPSADNALSIIKGNVNWSKNKKQQFSEYFTNSGSIFGYSFALLFACLLSVFQF